SRSRMVSLPPACWRSTLAEPPIARASSTRRRISSTSGCQLTGTCLPPRHTENLEGPRSHLFLAIVQSLEPYRVHVDAGRREPNVDDGPGLVAAREGNRDLSPHTGLARERRAPEQAERLASAVPGLDLAPAPRDGGDDARGGDGAQQIEVA